jgi:hypothetical protein
MIALDLTAGSRGGQMAEPLSTTYALAAIG